MNAAPPPSSAQRVAFRVDASRQIGAGHVMRCMALAQALRTTGIESTFISARLPLALAELLRRQGCDVVRIADSGADDSHALDQQADGNAVLAATGAGPRFRCLVVDHYGIGAEWETRLRASAERILAIDDLADRRHDADLLLDQNLQMHVRGYDALVPANCRKLLGPRFALLRPEFAARRAAMRAATERERVLLFAGGGDADNVTGTVLDAWRHVPEPRPGLDVVIGAMHARADSIRVQCAAMTGVRLHIQTDRMAELLGDARLLIGAVGTVSWERCCLGVPALMFSTADNQRFNLAALAAKRAGISLGDAMALQPEALGRTITNLLRRPGLIGQMARRAAGLVDGLGALRVAVLLSADQLALRAATADDVQTSWQWRNHPDTRRVSRDSRELPLADHRAWWLRSLEDPRRRLWIAHCGATDVGVLRFDVDGDSAEVSIYLDPGLNGLGLGPAMLRVGQRKVRGGEIPVSALSATILPGNRASETAFERTGFRRDGAGWVWSTTHEQTESKVNRI